MNFTPNRTARLRKGSPTQPALHLPLSQGYRALLDIYWSKSSYAKVCAINGMMEFLLKTDEVKKQKIPLLVKLGSGQSLLVTVHGRPPNLLHLRQRGGLP